MKRLVFVFVASIAAPSLALAWLAARSIRDQEYVEERQRRLLYQAAADTIAKNVAGDLQELQRDFGLAVDALLAESEVAALTPRFHESLREAWPASDVGFVVSLQGVLMCPAPIGGTPETAEFRLQNDRFLCSVDPAEVYLANVKGAMKTAAAAWPAAAAPGSLKSPAVRAIQPAHAPPGKGQASEAIAEESAFLKVVGDAQEGMLSRFLQDKLNLMVWRRSPQDPNLVFGAKVDLGAVKERIGEWLAVPSGLEGAAARRTGASSIVSMSAAASASSTSSTGADMP